MSEFENDIELSTNYEVSAAPEVPSQEDRYKIGRAHV